MTSNMIILATLATAFVVRYAYAIGENPMDFQTMAGMFAGIGQMLQNPLDTIDLPTDAIMGRWFQMYKAAMNFDVYRTQIYCPIAYFKPNRVMGEDGFSMEEAYRVTSKHGPIETFKRDLNKVGTGKYWMYTEEYFYPRQFYVIKAGPKYNNESLADSDIQYFIVTDASRLGLIVYARDPMVFYQVFNCAGFTGINKYNKEVTTYLDEMGFGGKVFWNSPKPIYQGPDCEWPSEKEVFARRVLKNEEANRRAANTTEMAPSALAEMVKNPQVALQKLMEMH